jgi:hypothetical protein
LFFISYSYITNLYTVNPTSFLISLICYAAVHLPQRWSTLCFRGNQLPHNPKRNLSALEVDLILLLGDLNGWDVLVLFVYFAVCFSKCLWKQHQTYFTHNYFQRGWNILRTVLFVQTLLSWRCTLNI